VLDGASYTYDNACNRKTRTDKRLGTTLTYGYDKYLSATFGQIGDYDQRELHVRHRGEKTLVGGRVALQLS
jgi:hypothetical protein